MIAAPNAARPLKRAIRSAINPRVRHPSTSTGIEAITKKTTGMIAGIIIMIDNTFHNLMTTDNYPLSFLHPAAATTKAPALVKPSKP